ncbi:MAG: hypothetical protein LBD80_00960 [Tannerella sp.]|jgi:hypothetical protein|nr:hypothetical protein [Tannerella sp.]
MLIKNIQKNILTLSGSKYFLHLEASTSQCWKQVLPNAGSKYFQALEASTSKCRKYIPTMNVRIYQHIS